MAGRWPFGGRQISTPVQLFILCVAVLLPAMAFAGVLTWRYSESERGLVYGNALDNARQISNGLDRDLNGRIGELRVLAISNSLATDNLETFHAQTVRARPILGGEITLRSVDGTLLADSRRPFGPPEPGALEPWEANALERSRAVVSDLIARDGGGHELAVSVPVIGPAGPRGVLTVLFPPAAVSAQLLQAGLPAEWTIAVVDGSGRIIGRSREPESFIGRMASDDLIAYATGRFGTWFGRTADGVRVLSGYTASDLSNWRVAVGVPVAAVEGPLNNSLISMGVLGLLGLLISAAVAVFFGGAISSAMSDLARLAAHPDRADREAPPATPLREVNTVSAALIAGAGELRRQARERDAAQAALSASRARLERLLNTAPIGILELSPTAITFANETARELLQLRETEPGVFTWPQWEQRHLSGEALGERENPAARALAGELVKNQEVVLVDPASNRRTVVSVNATPIADNGVVTGALASFVDISERFAAEEALREESRHLETLNATGATIAAQLDIEHLIQSVTDAGVNLTAAEFGAFFYNTVNERGEILTLYTISGVPRESFSKFPMPRNTKVFAPTFNGEGVVRSDDILLDPRYGHNQPHKGMPEGHLPVRSYLAVPVISRSGEVIGGLFFGHSAPGVFKARHERLLLGIAAQAAVAIDNARLYAAAQKAEAAVRAFNETLEGEIAARTRELSGANDRLRAEIAQRETVEEQLRQAQKMEAVGQLTGGLAHDFNNLLAIVIGSLDVLTRRLDRGSTEDLRRLIEAATDGANRAAALTQRLLAFARQQPLAPVVVDPNQLVTEMVELLTRTIKEKIQIVTRLESGVWQTHADRNQLENALLNLAVNARDAMPEGGTLTISTTNEVRGTDQGEAGTGKGEYVLIAVADTGTGMPQAVIERAFDPFFTTKEPGKGTGLGLSQIYGFVQQSGGHIEIESTVGEGTTVKMHLPRLVAPTGGTSRAEQPAGSAADRPRETAPA